MKTLIFLLVSIFAVGQVSAEPKWVSDDIKEEILEETGNTKKANGNIYIVNQNKGQNDNAAEAKNINKGEVKNSATADAANLPETLVEASPLVESYANNLRSQRQNAEIQTEQKIVEKLESARLEDEKSRAERLFGNKKFTNDHKSKDHGSTNHNSHDHYIESAPIEIIESAPPTITTYPAYPTVVQAPVVHEAPVVTAPVVVNEVAYEKKKHVKEHMLSSFFMSAGIGSMSYKAENVESKYAWNLGIGTMLDNNLSIEASMIYSQHRVDEFYGTYSRVGSYGFTDLDQFNWGLEARYNIPISKLNLYAGAYTAYVKRNYFGVDNGHHHSHDRGKDTEESTTAWNFAPVVGAEYALTKKVSLGLDLRYMMNFAQKFSSEDMKHSYRDYEEVPLEEINYSAITGKIKLNF